MQEQSESRQFPYRKRQNISDVSGDAANLFEDRDNDFEDNKDKSKSLSRSQSQEVFQAKRLGKKIKKQQRPDNHKKHRERQRDRVRDRGDREDRDNDRSKDREVERDRERDRVKNKKKERRDRVKDKRDRSAESESQSETQKKKIKKHKRATQQVRKSAKTQQQQRLDAICKTKAETILEKMKAAADHDIKTNKKGQASCQKLIYVKILTKNLETTSTAYYFIQADGLHQFERWLRKYPDGTEPSYSLKKQCFLILIRLPITGEALSRCQGLLSIVQKHQSSKERELKELADKLSFKWTNIMTHDDSD